MFTFLKSIIVALLTLLFTALSTNALENYKCSDIDVANLINGLKSGNEGLMRSCVYYAGKYEVEEVCDELVILLKTKKDPFDIVLIAMAIYRIGDENAMMELIHFVNNLEKSHVKNILTAIVFEYLVQNDIKFGLRYEL